MSLSEIKGSTVPVKLWAPLAEVESQALTQLRNIASLPWVVHHVAAMADVHLGIGATVGSVIAMKDAVCPAAVGVDIGCGMMAIETNLDPNDLGKLSELRSELEATVPVGFAAHETLTKTHNMLTDIAVEALFNKFKFLVPVVGDVESRARHQIGTLGGGNHFIEVCLDTDNHVWVMLHSGSRNIGKTLAEYHMGVAKKLNHNACLEDKALSVFLANTPEMIAYRHDLYWAQDYAALNRRVMARLIFNVLETRYPSIKKVRSVQCHHNYVSQEVHFGENVYVTRKGAISAQEGELGIIPGSMGTKSYIVEGRGNPESFNSASHGAGRRMSRGEAKRKFTVEDLAAQTAGVECRKDAGVLDEIPGCYKDIDRVMENQKDLVFVIAELKQLLCVKG
jgi:tRNA-splicing ligase RtcB